MTRKVIHDTGERYQLEFLSGVEEGIYDNGGADFRRETWKVLGTYEDRKLALQEAESPELGGRARVRVIDRGPRSVDRVEGRAEMTPSQAATEYLDGSGLDHLDEIDEWEHLERIVAAAIEADRAQRGDTEGQREE